jgi:hypothetical protein
MLGNIPEAVEHLRQVRYTGLATRTDFRVSSLYGITKDRHGIFNGLGNDIGFQQALQEIRDTNADTAARLRADFPHLFVDVVEESP